MTNVTQNPISVTGYNFKGDRLFVWFSINGDAVDQPSMLHTGEYWNYTRARLQAEGLVPDTLIGYLQAAPSKEWVFNHLADFMLHKLQEAAVARYERDLAHLAQLEGAGDPDGYLPENATLYLRNFSTFYSGRL